MEFITNKFENFHHVRQNNIGETANFQGEKALLPGNLKKLIILSF
jgi:hypothetical protein